MLDPQHFKIMHLNLTYVWNKLQKNSTSCSIFLKTTKPNSKYYSHSNACTYLQQISERPYLIISQNDLSSLCSSILPILTADTSISTSVIGEVDVYTCNMTHVHYQGRRREIDYTTASLSREIMSSCST